MPRLMRSLLKLAKRVGLLGASPLLMSVASLVAVPILVAATGASGWASIAIGQIVGDLGRVVVIWGWNSIGITRASSLAHDDRAIAYRKSLLPRLLLLVPVAVGAFCIAFLLPVSDRSAAGVMAVAICTSGLTAAWYFIADGKPMLLLLIDSVPRAVAVAGGSLVALAIGTPLSYTFVVLGGMVLSSVLPMLLIRAPSPVWTSDAPGGRLVSPFVEATRVLSRDFSAFAIGFVLVLRMNAPALLMTVLLPASGASIALADKFIKWINTALTPVMQAMQVWIGQGSSSLFQRIRRGLAAVLGIAVITALALISLIPPLSGLLSHDEIRLDISIAAAISVVSAMLFIGSVTANSALIMLGRARIVSYVAAVTTTILIVVLVSFSQNLTVGGAFWVFAGAETLYVLVQFALLVAAVRGNPVDK